MAVVRAWLGRTGIAVTVLTVLWATCGCGPRDVRAPARRVQVPDPPRIHPALDGVTIPPNVAPLTFVVDEPGERYSVRIESGAGDACETGGRSPRLVPPRRPWRTLLEQAAGGDLTVRVSVRDAEGTWRVFAPLVLHVSADAVDPYLAYRRIRPLYNFWEDVGVYQRDLGSWDEDVILHGRGFAKGCTNCHTFAANDPSTMAVGIRSREYGNATLLCREGTTSKLDTQWGYAAWRPDGRAAAYSLNRVRQFFHWIGDEVRDVCDLDSDLAVYYPAENRTVTAAEIAAPDCLETYPAWSADGTELYFCRAPIPWDDRQRMPPPGYRELRYSLVKVTFDAASGRCGPVQVVVSAEETGRSALLPRPSPDGKFLLFCMCDYGCFPIYQPGSDLHLLDLTTGAQRRLELNSERSESWHSWSSNGRWFAFSSKRQDGIFTRLYLAHVDPEGNVGKPFVLPQKDPAYYDSCLQTFSLPEFVTGRVGVSPRTLAAAARDRDGVAVGLPAMSMTAPAAGTPTSPGAHGDPWQPAPR
ncbi:MAG: PD40 domain-containing protein [Lentisphaeria bacterium]|nr:PD40 domain-containing protein [Lentisphaeria bacterium]